MVNGECLQPVKLTSHVCRLTFDVCRLTYTPGLFWFYKKHLSTVYPARSYIHPEPAFSVFIVQPGD